MSILIYQDSAHVFMSHNCNLTYATQITPKSVCQMKILRKRANSISSDIKTVQEWVHLSPSPVLES